MACHSHSWLAACIAASALAGCGGSGSSGNSTGGGKTRDIALQFGARAGDAELSCGKSFPGVGQNQRSISLIDLRFYVFDVKLVNKAGESVALDMPDDGRFQWKQAALLDFEDQSGGCENGSKETNTTLRGSVPEGEYTGVSFRVGLPPELNHGNPATQKPPLTVQSLSWNWLQGHKFMRVDVHVEPDGSSAASDFEMHLGAMGCSGSKGDYACTHENVPSVRLDEFDAGSDRIVFDVKALLASSKLEASTEADPPGCLSDPDDAACEPLFQKLGLDLASGNAGAEAQSVFRVERGTASATDRPAPSPTSVDAGRGGLTGGSFDLKLPSDFPPPVIPADNPLTEAKVELGRHLFYDKRLSGNQTQSCADCHRQNLAFTDGLPVGLGSTGVKNVRGSMSLANVVYASTLTWAQPDMHELERQALVPLFGEAPVELGLAGKEDELITRLKGVAKYQALFSAAFPDTEQPFTVDNVTRAIGSFERTLISGNSPYDRYSRDGDESAISDSAKRGAALFFTERLECFHCHGGFTFSDQINHSNQSSGESPFHNTGLYNLDLEGSYPMGNQGVYEVTKAKRDKGRFKAPTLRNIAVTAPYMHDGSIATLEGVLDHYAAGGRTITEGTYAGSVGFDNPNKDPFVHGFKLSEQERADVLAFLRSLTDEEFLTNPKFANPWN